MSSTKNYLRRAGLIFEGYAEDTRIYRLRSVQFPNLLAKMFRERDISVQVAVGNYDLGICGSEWIEELVVKYPASALVKVRDLGYGKGNLFVVASKQSDIKCTTDLLTKANDWRIVSEFPNLAENFALDLRLRRFRIFPVWGATEAYLPENADVALIWEVLPERLLAKGLVPLATLLDTSAFLIANKNSWVAKDMSQIITCLSSWSILEEVLVPEIKVAVSQNVDTGLVEPDLVWLALPDGHQQPFTVDLLKKARLPIRDYSRESFSRRPVIELPGVKAKVIRPQDIPLQVANQNFDVGITGRDWLLDHLYRFPSSPVAEVLDLGFGKVKLVAAVSQDLEVNDIKELRQLVKTKALLPLRVVSEYVNITDKYLCDNHLSPYKIIPTWGASESFLPEDADLLIENTETGTTLAKHKLKIIDTLFDSSACLIVNTALTSQVKKEKIELLVEILRRANTG